MPISTVHSATALGLVLAAALSAGCTGQGSAVETQAAGVTVGGSRSPSGQADDGDTEDDAAADEAARTPVTVPPGSGRTEWARAIVVAEHEVGAGASAYAIDEEDGLWVIRVGQRGRSSTVVLHADGAVRSIETEQIDRSDRAALHRATVTLPQAITIAIRASGGTLEEAELTEDDDRYRWEITVHVPTDDDDVVVAVDPGTGQVLPEHDD